MKALNTSLQHFVVQRAQLSNKEAVEAILLGKVLVNGQQGTLRQVLLPEDQVTLGDQIIKSPEVFHYFAYHKPRGVESTLNPEIENNLQKALSLEVAVFPVGRLDKESEGLMLLTNNGRLYNQISHPQHHQEKEYHVTVDKPLTVEALAHLADGVVIMGEKTRPALVEQLSSCSFSIVLTQGVNRQIRRMCYKLGYEVEKLVRIRIKNLSLGDLPLGQCRALTSDEVENLF